MYVNRVCAAIEGDITELTDSKSEGSIKQSGVVSSSSDCYLTICGRIEDYVTGITSISRLDEGVGCNTKEG